MPRIPAGVGSPIALRTVTSRGPAPIRAGSLASTVPDAVAPMIRLAEPSAATTYASALIWVDADRPWSTGRAH